MSAVIGITSAKGGAGKTLMATNLAAAMALGYQRKTVFIDLHPGLGTADLLLDLIPERSWKDLVPVLDELTSEQIRLAVTPYRPGLDLLAAPPEIELGQTEPFSGLTPLIEFLRDHYDLIVTDHPTGIIDSLSLVKTILVLLTPDAPSLRSTKRFLSGLDLEGQMVGAVINQYSTGGALKPGEIEGYLGIPVWGVLPVDGSGVWSNISYGEPCVLKRSSKLGKSIRALTARLLQLDGIEDE